MMNAVVDWKRKLIIVKNHELSFRKNVYMFSLNGVADPSCVPNRTKIRVELHLPDPLLPALVCFLTSGEELPGAFLLFLSLPVGTK